MTANLDPKYEFPPFEKIPPFRQALDTMRDLGIRKINFYGRVKVHGTNACVVITPELEVIVQSRNKIVLNGHYGFYNWVQENKQLFIDHYLDHGLDTVNETLLIFGEWAGGNIQKGVGVSGLRKFFYIFRTDLQNAATGTCRRAVRLMRALEHRDILEAKLHKIITIHPFNEVALAKAAVSIDWLVDEVEEECPVALLRGKKGIGVGLVWSNIAGYETSELLYFKTKGEKHCAVKPKKVKSNKPSLIPEKIDSLQDFAKYAVSPSRLSQGLQETGTALGDIKNLGKLITFVVKDTFAEESDVIKANNLPQEAVAYYIIQELKAQFFA